MIVSILLERDLTVPTGTAIDSTAGDKSGKTPFDQGAVLFLPLRTMRGVFAWVTSDHRIRSVFSAILAEADHQLLITSVEEALCRAAAVASTRSGVVHGQIGAQEQIVLEQFAFTVERHLVVDRLGEAVARNFFPSGYEFSWWQEKSRSDLIVVREELFKQLLLAVDGPGFAAEIRQSGRIPSESILALPEAEFAAQLESPAEPGGAAAEQFRWPESGNEGLLVLSNHRRPPTSAHLKKIGTIEFPLVAERPPRRGNKPESAGQNTADVPSDNQADQQSNPSPAEATASVQGGEAVPLENGV